MADYDFAKIEKKLSKYLDEDRFQHTMGVMYTSACLAMVHGYDIKDAQVSGLLHDCAKCIPNKKKLKMCSEHNIPVSDFERSHPFLLHSVLELILLTRNMGLTIRRFFLPSIITQLADVK
jgi:HD superfamily phosphohydrolase YqeK